MTESTHADARITLWLSEDLKTRLKAHHLAYGDSLSGYVRRAVQDRLLIETELEREGITIPDDDRERERLLRDLIVAGIDARDA
jgi:hypothetical protein